MAYNSRMSQQFHHGGQQQHNRNRKAKEDDTDAFLRLPDKVIAGCINDIGIPFTVADLLKPNPQQIQIIFEWFAELFMNTTRETVEPAMLAAAEDICGDHAGIIPPDSRNLMGFFVSLRKLMIQTAVIDEHFNKSENTKSRIESLYAENQELEQRLEEMHTQQREMEGVVKEKVRRNDELKARLLELRRNQERVAETFERVKGEKTRTQTLLEEKTEKLLKTRQESEKLRPYVSQSPAILQAALTELSENLTRDKIQIDNMERRMRALQMSMDTFSVISNDVQSCIKVLEDISAELQKEEEEDARAIRNKDALAERGNTVREVAQTERMLQRQLGRWHERTEALRKSAREKAEQAQARMEELHNIQKQLREERAEKQRDMERRRIRIEQTEKKMVDLKENIENEIHRAHDEYLKMESHIKLYITEMEKCL
uniref:Probable kinetochore protein NUF2 n=1 Tax=Coccidioides posadasii RMSCC 3488 TaxID=454284 RepID=A0A0J6FN09_COCPO|nr:hypothetical protein CPAG_08054 [Coccidioides posadasii RMSCC 3488]